MSQVTSKPYNFEYFSFPRHCHEKQSSAARAVAIADGTSWIPAVLFCKLSRWLWSCSSRFPRRASLSKSRSGGLVSEGSGSIPSIGLSRTVSPSPITESGWRPLLCLFLLTSSSLSAFSSCRSSFLSSSSSLRSFSISAFNRLAEWTSAVS